MEYYTYAYLREDKTPYYIGKGKGDRAYRKNKTDIKPPKDKSRIIFLKQNLLEQEAFKHEIYMIAVFGRKDLGTGILHNKTNGGEGKSGWIPSEEIRKKWSNAAKGEKNGMYCKTHTDEAKEKIRNVHIGRIWSDELKLKKANSMKGENNHFYNKTHNKETKEKIIERHRKLYKLITPKGEVIEEYCTIRELCRKYDLERKQLSDLISKKKKTYKGWTVPVVSTST